MVDQEEPTAAEFDGEAVSAAAWNDARAVFGRLATGTTADDPNGWMLAKAMVHIPALVAAINDRSGSWSPGGLEHWGRGTPVVRYAFDHATMALSAAADGLTGMYAMVVVGAALPSHAVITLARQVCEGALRARWILGDLSVEQLTARGYAAAVEDLCQQAKFVDAALAYGLMGADDAKSERRKNAEARARLISEGRAHDLIHRPRSANDLRPRVKVPSKSALFQDVPGPIGPAGDRDLRWMYALMSGAAHGLSWAVIAGSLASVVREYLNYTDDGTVTPSGVVVTRTDPNTLLIALCAMTAVISGLDALDKFNTARDTPCPQ